MKGCNILSAFVTLAFLALGTTTTAQSLPGHGYALDNGDVNGDWDRDLSDGVYLLSFLFSGGPEPVPLALCGTDLTTSSNGDTNADGEVDVSDPILLLGWLFSGGPVPVPPCGEGFGAGGNPHPRIVPPYGRLLRRVYAELSARWWQWAIALPVAAHPLFDTADCNAGQEGTVWFLGGAFTGTTTTRECTVPRGKAIFIPVLNVECSTVEPPPFFGANEAELRACAAAFQDPGTGMFATIDGHEVHHLDRYRVQSPLFDFDAPADNILFIPGPVSGESVSDGVWILLAPLSNGSHTIRFGGSFPGFPIDVTYNITVK